MDALVTFQSTEGVGFITFNHAPANAYQIDFQKQFNAAIDEANAHRETRVVIVRSAIEKFFCAGADIKVFLANSTEDNKQMVSYARSALAKIEASGKIYIAELNGHTLGGGLEIAMACDLRFASEKSFLLGLPEAKLGLLPGNGGSQRLPRLIGASRAVELLVSGDNIHPGEAHRIGLVNRLFPEESLAEETLQFARKLAKGAPLANAAVKKSVNRGMEFNLEDALMIESALVDELYDTKDAQEGFASFIEKRPPIYKGE